MGMACLKFVEKAFVGNCKIMKFVKAVSLENFSLYYGNNVEEKK